jgi:hypothetical protein
MLITLNIYCDIVLFELLWSPNPDKSNWNHEFVEWRSLVSDRSKTHRYRYVYICMYHHILYLIR